MNFEVLKNSRKHSEFQLIEENAINSNGFKKI